MQNINIDKSNQRIIRNAISAYLMIFIAWLLNYNKNNPYINNDFVKNHVKSASIIHFWFFLVYLIFIFFWLFNGIEIFWLWVNNIVADILFMLLLILLVLWIYKAEKWETLSISNTINITKKISVLDIDWDWEITEKEKLTIILSYVPFIWFINYWKYSDNSTIEEATKVNTAITLLITFIYILQSPNLANLITLSYIILIVFIWINLFTRNELIQIKIHKLFSAHYLRFYIITFLKYLKNYFSEEKFKDLNTILEIENKKIIEINKDDKKYLNDKKEIRQAKALIYIPIVNFFFLFLKNTKYHFHIINWIILSFIFITLIVLSFFININNYYFLLIVIPMLFGIWLVKHNLEYKMPFIYDIYVLFWKITWLWKKVNQKRKEINELNLKVEKNKI